MSENAINTPHGALACLLRAHWGKRRLRFLQFWGRNKSRALARFIREGAESGLWGDEITPNIMAWG